MNERLVQVLRDPEGYQRRNREAGAAGFTSGMRIRLDGSTEDYQVSPESVETSREHEWIEIAAEDVEAHYACLKRTSGSQEKTA